MELYVNDQQAPFSDPFPKNLDSLIKMIVDNGDANPDSFVCGIRLDGKDVEIDPKGLAHTRFNPEESKKMEVFFENKEILLKNMLEDGIRFCEMAKRECKALGTYFRKVELETAGNKFAGLLQEMMVFLGFIQKLGDFTASICPDYDNMEQYGHPIEKLSNMIHLANEAQNEGDWNLLADILEHESTVIFNSFVDAIDHHWMAYKNI